MISIGEKIPDVSFMNFGAGGLSQHRTSDMFSGKRVLLIGIPGAFTPVCSGNHLPAYVQDSAGFLDLGIDEIMCISVNDAFVMRAFGDAQNANGKVAMVADSDGEFTRKIGLDVDASAFGLGIRSQRYAMVVNDGMVEAIETEDNFVDHGVSSADHMKDLLSKQMATA